MKLRRYDYACPFAVREDAPTPELGSAARTPEGYLLVDAYLARSGLLEYSDGVETWIEYRPKDELRKAADSWQKTPITDEHPDDMVDASNWTQLAKGHHVDAMTVEELDDGEDYIRARVLITDLSMVDKVCADGGPRELSIGFAAAIVPTESGRADDGTRCDAVQVELEGNHVAILQKGRAGPAARLLMDGAAYLRPRRTPMPQNKQPAKKPENKRADEIGAPTDMVEVTGPDGQTATVPSWIAAIVEQAQAQLAAPTDAQAIDPAQPQPAAPAAPAPAPAAPAAPVAQAPIVPQPQAPTQADLQRVRDEAQADGRRRARLERLAVAAGIAEDKIDAADSTDALARLYILAKLPNAKVEKVRGDALDAFVETARTLPEPKPEPVVEINPFAQPLPVRGDSADEVDDNHPTVRFMKRQGY